jgi:16S rRNA (uracil1498-N3)-methyltransferase
VYRFFADSGQIGGGYIRITGSDVNHIKNVLRMRIHDRVYVSDKKEKEYICLIERLEEESVLLKIERENSESTELPARIVLFQGLPKKDKMEWIVQKAVELGAGEIVPVAMRRSVVKIDEKREEKKIERWRSIAESAAKQSKRFVIPKVTSVMSWDEAVSYSENFSVRILPYERAESMDQTKKIVENIKPGMEIGVFIGPEGGFDDSEIEFAIKNGILPVTLGKRILRTETAGMTMLSILMYHLEED